MARIRSIKPDFFTSEKIANLPLSARLLFIGLWTHVDDNGVTVDNEKLINAAVWPLEDDPLEALQRTREDLRRLSESSLIVRYKAAGKTLIFITGWDEHQKVSHPAKPRYPRPTADQIRSSFTLVSSQNGVTPDEEHQSSGESPEDLPKPPETLAPEQGAGSREQGEEETSSSGGKAADLSPELAEAIDRVCDHLAQRIVANGSKPPTIGKKWRDAARLMMTADGRTEEQIHKAIDWCQQDEFWRSHVMSMPKLREKYDSLRLQASAKQTRGPQQQQPAPSVVRPRDRWMERQ